MRRTVLLPIAGAFLLVATALVTFWMPGPAGAQDSTTATPTPSPTPSPPDANLAAAFAYQGKFDEAIGAYRAAIDQGTQAERLAAQFPLARVYLDDNQIGAAIRQLDTLLLEAPVGFDVRAAQYLLAETLASRADWQGALPLYDAYIEAGGGASLYAAVGRVPVLGRLGRGLEAVPEAERLLEEELPLSVRLGLILTVAQALEASQPIEALTWYDRLRQESAAPVDQALALWSSALIQRDLGDEGPLTDAWRTIIQQYPETSTAQAIIDEPPSPIDIDTYYVGLVYFRSGRDAEARKAFQASLTRNEVDGQRSLAARASYYLAILDEGAGDFDAAIDGYARVLKLDDSIELADDALWWRGRLLEQEGRATSAAIGYRRLVAQFRDSNWAPEARFRLALLDYDGKRYKAAAESFADIAGSVQNEERQRALLWQGKALAAAGDDEAAEAVWTQLQAEAPDEYYSLRAAVLLGAADGELKDAALEDPGEPDWLVIESWLLEGGDDPAPALESLFYDEHWGLGQELLALGMRRRAGTELGLLLEEAGRDAAALYQLGRSAHSAGLIDLSSRAATRLLFSVPAEDAASAPLDLWELAYPAPFLEALREAADDADVPDVLLLALVRLESFFDPLAGSSAGALGLTQVIPATGDAIADDLGMADFEIEDLYRPALSLRFGAYYLSEQMAAFDGNVYQALAAFNAGPGIVARWQDAADDDVDRFVAEIEFSQTRAYVQLVSENLARYRQIYQGLAAPSLPKD